MMNKKQVIELFKFLKSVYPNFEVDQYKIDTWTKLLKDQNPATVMKNAERYAMENKFMPGLADVREKIEYPEDRNVVSQVNGALF